jgi:hypothetical protein
VISVIALLSTVVTVALLPGRASAQSASTTVAAAAPGYIVTSAAGAVLTFGPVPDKGSLTALGVRPAAPIIGSAITSDFGGYWLAGVDGGVFAFGNARFYGSCREAGSGCRQNTAGVVIDIVATPDGKGYWLASLDGGVYAFGDAPYLGSAGRADPALPGGGANVDALSAPVISMAIAGRAPGYWLATSDGAVLPFGKARSFGSLAGKSFPGLVVAIAGTPDGGGYWLTSTAGTVYTFGDAKSYGGCTQPRSGCERLNAPIGSMAATPDGRGYWLFGIDGGVFAFGDAHFYGSVLSAAHSARSRLDRAGISGAGRSGGRGPEVGS